MWTLALLAACAPDLATGTLQGGEPGDCSPSVRPGPLATRALVGPDGAPGPEPTDGVEVQTTARAQQYVAIDVDVTGLGDEVEVGACTGDGCTPDGSWFSAVEDWDGCSGTVTVRVHLQYDDWEVSSAEWVCNLAGERVPVTIEVGSDAGAEVASAEVLLRLSEETSALYSCE